jgi:hypothetical protein
VNNSQFLLLLLLIMFFIHTTAQDEIFSLLNYCGEVPGMHRLAIITQVLAGQRLKLIGIRKVFSTSPRTALDLVEVFIKALISNTFSCIGEPPSLNSILPFGSSVIHNRLRDVQEETVSCGAARVFILTVVLTLLGGCNEHGSLLKCPLGVSAGRWTLFGRSSWPATPPNFTCSTKAFSIGVRKKVRTLEETLL